MAQPKPWIEEIVEAMTELGGKAQYKKLYEKIKKRDQMNFLANPNWTAAIRQTIEYHSSDSSVFKPNKKDIFYSVNGLGHGTWGLRSHVQQTPTPIDNEDVVNPAPQAAPQVQQTIYRYLRDTKIARDLKASYEDKCQLCGVQISVAESNTYSEAHHIKPLGKDGPDVQVNMIVLCPNHHAEFDYGGIAIDPETLKVIHSDPNHPIHDSEVRIRSGHELERDYLEFHLREIFRHKPTTAQD